MVTPGVLPVGQKDRRPSTYDWHLRRGQTCGPEPLATGS